MTTVSLGDATLGYDEAGTGPVVILVHAGCADRRMWVHQMAPLAARYRVVRYDWRGYGESSDATGTFAHRRDLLALMDVLDVRRATLVGASDGGRIALDTALTAPDRVTALVLMAPGLSGHQWPASMMQLYRDRVHAVLGADALRGYRSGEVEPIDEGELSAYSEAETEFLVAGPDRSRTDLHPQVWDLAVAMDRDLNRRMWSRPPTQEQAMDPPAEGRLHEVGVPTLVINGAADLPDIVAVSALLADRIPGAHRVELPETGHLPALERPWAVNAALMSFLDEAQREAS